MATTKKSTRLKEPVKVRTKKLADGSESYYLDIYVDGKRSYEFLKLYLLPEINPMVKEQNRATKSGGRGHQIKTHHRTDSLEGRTEKDIRPFQNATGRLDGSLSCRTGTKRRERTETVTNSLPVTSPLQEKGEDERD